MKPYLDLLVAKLQGQDVAPHLAKLQALPALKQAFADFDNASVIADLVTMSESERLKILDLLKLRPMLMGVLKKYEERKAKANAGLS